MSGQKRKFSILIILRDNSMKVAKSTLKIINFQSKKGYFYHTKVFVQG